MALPETHGAAHARSGGGPGAVPILVYHRFGAAVSDSMTVRTGTFQSHLLYLKQHGHAVVPLHDVIAWLTGRGAPPPPRAVVMTADDGHESVFTQMWPVVREAQVPVTLFIYPSAISNASYAMTWPQLRTLRGSGLFDIQSHTYWHPNFATEKRRLVPSAYRDFAEMQLCKSRAVVEARLGGAPDVVAWPFGIYDEGLFDVARACGYVAGVTLERRAATPADPIMMLPRLLMTDDATGARFAAMLGDGGGR